MMSPDNPSQPQRDPLSVVFFGTDEFAVRCLGAVADHDEVTIPLVVTMPDRPKGRGHRTQPTPVKVWAAGHDLPVITPDTLHDPAWLDRVKRVQPDVFVVVAYGKKLPPSWLALPRKGAFNVHASLLPAYRGAAPVEWALYHGEKKTGVTIIRMSERMDAGDIVWQREEPIRPTDTAGTLKQRLAGIGAEGLTDVLRRLASGGELRVRAQDETKASRAPRLTKADARLDWKQPAERLARGVRAFDPRPGAWTMWRARRLRITAAEALVQRRPQSPPGTIEAVTKDGWVVAAGEGCLLIKEVHPEGGRRMSASAYAAGVRPRPGERMG